MSKRMPNEIRSTVKFNLPKEGYKVKSKGHLLAMVTVDENGEKVLKLKNRIYYMASIINIQNAIQVKEPIKNGEIPRCPYCGRELDPRNTTIDHTIPRSLGGPTIQENLEVICDVCNSLKGSLKPSDVYKIRSMFEQKVPLETIKNFKYNARKQYFNEMIENKGIIPKEWLVNVPVKKVRGNKNIDLNSLSFRNAENFYYNYGFLRNTIVVDKKDMLLEGRLSFALARELNLKNVDIIKVSNVDVDLLWFTYRGL